MELDRVMFDYNLLSDENKAFVYQLILKLLPYDNEELTADEIEETLQGRQQIESGDYFTLDEIKRVIKA